MRTNKYKNNLNSGKKMKFPDIKRLVKDNIKKHKETYELLSK